MPPILKGTRNIAGSGIAHAPGIRVCHHTEHPR